MSRRRGGEPPLREERTLRPACRPALWAAGIGVLVLAVAVIASQVDQTALAVGVSAMADTPGRAAVAVGAFGAAFVLRSAVWVRVLPGLGLRDSLTAVHLGLAANHVLPLRMGEAVRPLVAARRGAVSPRAAASSTLVLRVADVAALLALGWVVAPDVLGRQLGWVMALAPIALIGAYLLGLRWLRSLPDHRAGLVRAPDLVTLAGTLAAWVLEAVLIWQCAHWVGLGLSPPEALVVTSASVGAQIAGVAPGGVGTYEAGAVAAYTALGYSAGPALAAAVLAHGISTAYALVGGAFALVLPSCSRTEREVPCLAPAPPS